jgi:hypothetical protein
MKYLIITLASILVLSCAEEEIHDAIISDGVLAWYGDPEVDGCGLVLEVDTSIYFVSANKNAVLKFTDQDSFRIEVRAQYLLLERNEEYLGCRPQPIKILDIQRR